ncbi:MAG: penicillin acylase family protein [Acidobacteria bacterium]|nr:penicillin acylase family protein [Acidobacteriota bacterium]
MAHENLFRAAVPDATGTARLKGLEGGVEVLRDGLGIPHVRARTVHDVFFAQGFVHAQDRLWQMDLDRRRAAGRAAEWLGRGALSLDVFARRLGLVAAGRADYDALGAGARAVLDAYAAGVNAFIETARALPAEMALLGAAPEPWRPWDSAAVLKIRHVLMGSMDLKLWRARIARALGPRAAVLLGSPHGREDTLIVPVGARGVWSAPALAFGEDGADGSNNWAVHGSRTASGKPLLAGDPHRMLEVPNVYCQIHIACPAFDAVGLSMPGVPGLSHFGHNGSVAWCITHAMADAQDLFVERFDSGLRFELRGEWLPSVRREERIRVSGEAPAPVDITVTAHGPIVFGDPATGTAIALRWTGTDAPNRSLDAVLPMLEARSVGEMDEAMRPWVDPCNNFVTADVHGQVAYLHRGRVPVRSRANAWAPVAGRTGEHDWRGDVPFENLPRLRDPETGFIVTANNRVCDDSYPHYLGMDYSAPGRARRILERLGAIERATAEDMISIHADRVSIASRAIVEAVARIRPTDGRLRDARETLVAWNGSMDPDAVAPSLYAAIRDEIAGALLEREPLARLAENPFPEEPYPIPPRARIRSALPRLLGADPSLLGVASWDEVVGEALGRAVDGLESALGPDPSAWRWSRLHVTQTAHPLSGSFPEAAAVLDPPAVPVGGDADTVLASSAVAGLGVQHASVARYVFDLGDWDRSGWVIPLGSSGHSASPHYADQAPAWRSVCVHPMTYSWERVEVEAEARQMLEPR